MNEVANVNANAVAALKGLKSGLRRVADKLPDASGSQYLRMGKDGVFVFGKDDLVVPPGTEAILNVLDIQHGYSAWTNKPQGQGKNELRGEIMRPISVDLPHVSELDQYKDAEWRDQMAATFKLIGGKHANAQLTYKASSRGGLSAMKTLLDLIAEKLDEDDAHCFPVVAIDSDSYKHSSYGKTFVPKFDVVGWANMAGDVVYDDGEEPEVAPAKIEAEPVSGRRRRTAD